jgi:hypothetical protein
MSIDIHNSFFPNQHIEDPKYFAGRKTDIEKALKSLCARGSSLMVFGERGVGKSSFANMIKCIAGGELHLLYKHNYQKLYPPDLFKYKIISFECDAESTTTAKVLQRLITSPNGIKSIISSRIDSIETVVKDKQTLDLFKIISFGGETESKVTRAEFREESIFETFTNLIISISKFVLNGNEGLLIAIDEFDLVRDSSKMASLIKNLSKNNVKFLISGIAESYEQLLDGHASVSRQFTFGRINITPMTFNEVADLFRIVEENNKNQIRFDESFIKEVYECSNGYPYFVQLFGQLSLDSYMQTNPTKSPIIIHKQYLTSGLKKLSFYEYEMDKQYRNIIKENPLKELVIKFLAKTISKKIRDEEIYTYCYKQEIMQPQPKNIVASLLGQRDPQFLVRESEESDYVSFINPLFKIYVNSRDPELLRSKNGEYFIPK